MIKNNTGTEENQWCLLKPRLKGSCFVLHGLIYWSLFPVTTSTLRHLSYSSLFKGWKVVSAAYLFFFFNLHVTLLIKQNLTTQPFVLSVAAILTSL